MVSISYGDMQSFRQKVARTEPRRLRRIRRFNLLRRYAVIPTSSVQARQSPTEIAVIPTLVVKFELEEFFWVSISYGDMQSFRPAMDVSISYGDCSIPTSEGSDRCFNLLRRYAVIPTGYCVFDVQPLRSTQ